MDRGPDELAGVQPLPDLPFEIQLLVDRLVARFDGTDPLATDPGLIELGEWLEDARDDLTEHWDGEPSFAPIIPEAETANLSDQILAESREETEEVVIDDDARVEFVTRHLRDLLTGEVAPDGDYHPACGFRRLRASDGRTVLIAYGLRGYSFSGTQLEWLGLFESPDRFRARQRRAGWLFDLGDLEAMSRERKLAIWDRTEFG